MGGATFVILSFEGPDRYAHAGGLGSRVTELSMALSSMGFETHLFFVGDPALPGLERVEHGDLTLHRWCQWISRYHPAGVYDGEEGKLYDWTRSLPPWLETEVLAPTVAAGGSVVVLAEEWHTAGSALALSEAATRRGWQGRVRILWNANNTFSFGRIDWEALKRQATVTTVSRYMKQVMGRFGVDARVVPNGVSASWLEPLEIGVQAAMARLLRGRLSLVKVARWDPDKRWDVAVDAVWEMKRMGLRPLLLARGGVEPYGQAVLERARQRGLTVGQAEWDSPEAASVIEAIRPAMWADVVDLRGYLSQPQRKLLFRASDGVLANSGVEPFGLVGLEAMAVGGVAFVGCTGEDYATPGHDAISIQTGDAAEVAHHAAQLRGEPAMARRLRRAARQTARRYTWESVASRVLLPMLRELGLSVTVPVQAPGEPAREETESLQAPPAGLAPGLAGADVAAPTMAAVGTARRNREEALTLAGW